MAGAGDPAVPGAAASGPGLRVTTLPSGRRVVTDAVPGAASATVVALVEVGGRDEPADLAGASHFLEHLLCKGSADLPAVEVAESIDRRGGDLDAVTDRERTAVQLRVPADESDFALGLLGRLVLTPALRDEDVEVERRVILEELAQAEEDLEDRAHTLTAAALYPGHPLGREVIGDRDTLAAMGRDEIASFHRSHYRPDDMVVAAAGRVDHDEVVDAVARWDRGGAGPVEATRGGGRRAPVPRSAPPAGGANVQVLRRPGEQVHLVVGWPFGRVGPGEREASAVLAHIVGGGPASRLFRVVRDERGLAYTVDASLSLHSDAGALTAYAATSPARVAEVRRLIADEVADIAERGPTAHEVEVAKGYLSGSYALALEDSATRAWRVAIEELERGGARPADERIDAYRRVTIDAVHAVARRLVGDPTVVAVGPVRRRHGL